MSLLLRQTSLPPNQFEPDSHLYKCSVIRGVRGQGTVEKGPIVFLGDFVVNQLRCGRLGSSQVQCVIISDIEWCS